MAKQAKCAEPQLRTTNLPDHQLSIDAGDLVYLDGRLYVTHSGLLKVARRNRCCAITTTLVSEQSDPGAHRFVFKSVVYKAGRSKGFEGYGDADPSNVSSLVRGAGLRVAETRAVSRALRKAYGVGLCSVEELGTRTEAIAEQSYSRQQQAPAEDQRRTISLRNELALIIRHHHLDAEQVKHYALALCGVTELRQASRKQISDFVAHLRSRAEHDYPELLRELAATVPKRPQAVTPVGTEKEVA